MSNELKFADSVWHRVVQIVQEAMLTGVDCADLLRQIRVVRSSTHSDELVLSQEYEKHVKTMHDEMLRHAKSVQESQVGNKFLVTGTESRGDFGTGDN